MSDFKVAEVTEWRLMYDCPSCRKPCDFVEIDRVCHTQPTCPHCGFDMRKYEEEKERERVRRIEENPYCQLYYSVLTAADCGVTKHPQEQMLSLGYKLIDSIPQSIADCWWFTVDRFIEPLPPYLSKMRYQIGEP